MQARRRYRERKRALNYLIRLIARIDHSAGDAKLHEERCDALIAYSVIDT